MALYAEKDGAGKVLRVIAADSLEPDRLLRRLADSAMTLPLKRPEFGKRGN